MTMKAHYMIKMTHRGQTITELAVFGSLLLLVLAYFVRWGIILNHQQYLNMRAFRLALTAAYYDAPCLTPNNASSTVVLAQDKRVPDPQDTTGLGTFQTAQAQSTVVWGDNLLETQADPLNPLQRTDMRYVINGNTKSYITSIVLYWWDSWNNGFWTDLPYPYAGPVYKKFSNGDVICYRPGDPSDPNLPPGQARITVNGYNYTIESFARSLTGIPNNPADAERIRKPIVGLCGETNCPLPSPNGNSKEPVNGEKIVGFFYIDTEAGDIDTYYQDPDYVRQQPNSSPDELQGLLPSGPAVTMNRYYTLSTDELPTKSSNQINNRTHDEHDVTITHQIRWQKPTVLPPQQIDNFTYTPYNMHNRVDTTLWQTKK